MTGRRLLATIELYQHDDGTFGASWDCGGTWDWLSSGEALYQVADALSDIRFAPPDVGSPSPFKEEER